MNDMERYAFISWYLAAASHLGGRSFLSENLSTHPSPNLTKCRQNASPECSTPVRYAKCNAATCYLLAPHFLLMVWAMSVPLAKV